MLLKKVSFFMLCLLNPVVGFARATAIMPSGVWRLFESNDPRIPIPCDVHVQGQTFRINRFIFGGIGIGGNSAEGVSVSMYPYHSKLLRRDYMLDPISETRIRLIRGNLFYLLDRRHDQDHRIVSEEADTFGSTSENGPYPIFPTKKRHYLDLAFRQRRFMEDRLGRYMEN